MPTPPDCVRVCVHYPTRPGDRLVLRTSRDWGADLLPVGVDEEGTRWRFELPLADPPHVYFKACRVRDGVLAWSVGENGIALPGTRNVYPHFDGGLRGEVSEPHRIGERTVRVYTPAGYAENVLKRYPTLYVHDGANVFFPEEAFTGVEWRVDETLDTLDALQLVDRLIVVAVHATPDRREEEYTAPGWAAYRDELVDRVKPTIDERFRTRMGPEFTGVMGSSFGGVLSFYLAWERPDVFGVAACLSPSFGLRDDFAERVFREEHRNVRVWLDSGWPSDNHQATRAVRDALLARGFTMGRDLMHLVFPGEKHHESAWSARLHLPLQFLFGEAFRRRG